MQHQTHKERYLAHLLSFAVSLQMNDKSVSIVSLLPVRFARHQAGRHLTAECPVRTASTSTCHAHIGTTCRVVFDVDRSVTLLRFDCALQQRSPRLVQWLEWRNEWLERSDARPLVQEQPDDTNPQQQDGDHDHHFFWPCQRRF